MRAPEIDAAPRRLLSPDILGATRAYLARHVAPLTAKAAAGEGGIAGARALARAYDGLLSAYFLGAHATLHRELAGMRVALVAVGGYGHGLLAPGSDLDLILLTDAADPAALDPLADLLLYPLWDAGVSLGHAVRTAEALVPLAREDLRTATAVLDARVIAGDEHLAAEALGAARRAAVDADLRGFLDKLSEEMAGRHGRFGGSVYLLEPEIKHGRGGLRDMDIARWAFNARWHARDFTDALRVGALGEPEHARLMQAKDFVWRLRAAMHGRVGRRADRLTFDEQEECAQALGLVDASDIDRERAIAEGAERLMSRWYRHARDVASLVDHTLELARAARTQSHHPPRLERVAPEITRFEGTLCFAHTDSLRRDPVAALRLIEEALAHGLPVAGSSRATIFAATREGAWCEALRAAPESGAAFLRLISHSAPAALRAGGERAASSTPENPASVLAELHDLGLLLAMIPEFEAVTARVQHDVYHVYTVDVHSVAAVDRLHAIARGELSDAYALATGVLAGIDRRELLCLATLLHDVGKAHGRHHAKAGAAMAAPIARRLGLGDDDAETVSWLVLEHLTLYHLATRRDLHDEATLARVAETFRDPWRLDALYLLTVADLSTTSPTAMTSWKAHMLEELYDRARPGVSARPGVEVDRAEALAAQAVLGGATPEERALVEDFVRTMPPRYLLATHPETIRRHARRVGRVRAGEVRLCVDHLPGDASGTLVEVVVACPDRPGLLALLAALLHAWRLDVQHAEIHTRDAGALDVFAARAPAGRPLDARRLEAAMRSQLDALLAGEVTPESLVMGEKPSGWSRAEPAVPQKVRVQQDASATATVVEVFGRDRPGFLYAVTHALHALGLVIHLAKVNTEGRRAADVFYVTGGDGAKLSAARAEEVRAAVLAVLG